jgi:putative protease
LLAPAGNFEKFEIAIHYGADAIYLGGKSFSLRNFADNFSMSEMQSAVELAHRSHVKVYVTCNIYPRNFEQRDIQSYLEALGKIGPDAVIISDPGVFMQARKIIPDVPIHISTQANTTNYQTVEFWEKLGAKRINVARELSLSEIKEIASRSSIEIEAFVHGAMCISYSGRCLLSSFMAQRDSNRGMCCHPCRFSYTVMEAKRPGQYYPIAEDSLGTYIFNSRDLCMIEHLPQLIDTGLRSLKIEGRMKGINYLASCVQVYREAIDAYYQAPDDYTVKPEWMDELNRLSHRGYCTGFYFGDPDQVQANTRNLANPGSTFVGKILETDREYILVDVRNKFLKTDQLEVFGRKGPSRPANIQAMADPDHVAKDIAQPGSRVWLKLSDSCEVNDLLRLKAS